LGCIAPINLKEAALQAKLVRSFNNNKASQPPQLLVQQINIWAIDYLFSKLNWKHRL